MEIPVEAVGQYFNYLENQSWISLLLGVFFLVAIVTFVGSIIEKRKTKIYREDLTNLYVAGKIKQIAEKDSIDLKKEVKEFRKFEKLMSSSYKELDKVLEDEMKEKIQDDFEEAKHR
jgi:hypothetical protein